MRRAYKALSLIIYIIILRGSLNVKQRRCISQLFPSTAHGRASLAARKLSVCLAAGEAPQKTETVHIGRQMPHQTERKRNNRPEAFLRLYTLLQGFFVLDAWVGLFCMRRQVKPYRQQLLSLLAAGFLEAEEGGC